MNCETNNLNDGPLEFHENSVSGFNHCQSTKAGKLILIDIAFRLKKNDQFDIGGTYTNEEPNFWFYYTTSEFLPNNYLLNIFVRHRKSGTFTVGLTDNSSNEMRFESDSKCEIEYYIDCPKYTFLPNSMVYKTFKSPKADVSHHIITYHFTENVVKELENKILCIPIKLDLNPNKVDRTTLLQIKRNHSIINSIIRESKPDFILESATKKQYPMHKIFLAAHSPVFQDLIQSETNNIALDVNDEVMEVLIEYFYTGTVKDIENKNMNEIQDVSNKFQIDELKVVMIKTLCDNITIENAIDLVVLSEKYKLEEVQESIFKFITKNNAAIMKTDGWKNLNDAEITKKMLKAFYSN